MSTIITAAILVAITIAIPLALISIRAKKRKKRMEENLKLFAGAGSNHGLSFSTHEVLKKQLIGLDELSQVLFIYGIENGSFIYINMKEVNNCVVNKKYDSIDVGSEKRAEIQTHLKSLDLELSFKGKAQSALIPFYDSNVNSIYEMAESEEKAKKWETLLSGHIVKELKAIA